MVPQQKEDRILCRGIDLSLRARSPITRLLSQLEGFSGGRSPTSAVAHCYPQRGAPAFVFSHTSLQLFVQPAVSFDSTLALFTITARTRRENCGTSRTEV